MSKLNESKLHVKKNYIVGTTGISYVSILELFYAEDSRFVECGESYSNFIEVPKETPIWLCSTMFSEEQGKKAKKEKK